VVMAGFVDVGKSTATTISNAATAVKTLRTTKLRHPKTDMSEPEPNGKTLAAESGMEPNPRRS